MIHTVFLLKSDFSWLICYMYAVYRVLVIRSLKSVFYYYLVHVLYRVFINRSLYQSSKNSLCMFYSGYWRLCQRCNAAWFNDVDVTFSGVLSRGFPAWLSTSRIRTVLMFSVA